MLALPVLVVLDEAYVDFSTEPSRLDWVLRHDNLVVLRTFSKSAGLAGPWKHLQGLGCMGCSCVCTLLGIWCLHSDISVHRPEVAGVTPSAFGAHPAASQQMWGCVRLPFHHDVVPADMRRAAGGLRRLPHEPHHLHVARKAAVQCVGRLGDGSTGSAHQPSVPRQGGSRGHMS